MRKRARLGGTFPAHSSDEWPFRGAKEEILAQIERARAEHGGKPRYPARVHEIDPERKRGGNRAGDFDYRSELHPFNPPSWFHETGIHKVVKRLEPRLPAVGGSLFLTFTVDPKEFQDAESGFEWSRNHLRKVFYALRKGVEWEGKRFRIDAPYCVKVEFHQSGWPHFHVIFLTRRFLPGGLVNELWACGRTNVERISTEKFRYLLKYVTKPGDLPEWVLNRERFRVFQSSRGFLKPLNTGGQTEKTDKPEGEELEVKREASTIGQRLERWRRMGLIREGTYCRAVTFDRAYVELIGEQVLTACKEGRYLGRMGIAFKSPGQLQKLLTSGGCK